MEIKKIALPCEGSRLISFKLVGNGKDRAIELKTIGHPLVALETPKFSITEASGVAIHFQSLDDVNVELQIIPHPDRSIVVKEAKIDFWPDDVTPEELFESWGERKFWEPNYAFPLTLSFVPGDKSV